jgi:hypothetical protein
MESNTSIGFSEHLKKNHVTKAKSVVSISILIGILLLSIISIPVQVVLADPASYTLQAQKKDFTWTTGLVSGYVGCENVPFRLIATYGVPDKGQTFTIKVWGASVDTDTPTNRGIDYLAGFTYSDPDNIIASGPTIDTFSFPYAGGAGTGILVTQSDGVQHLEYTITFTLKPEYAGNKDITFFWGAHLALSPFGATEWIGPPTTNIQGGATPPSGGVKTVNIQKPVIIVTTTTTDTTTTDTTTTDTTTTDTTTTDTTTTDTTTTDTTTTDTTTTDTPTTDTTTTDTTTTDTTTTDTTTTDTTTTDTTTTDTTTTDTTTTLTTTRTTKTTDTTQTIEEFEDPLAPVGGYVMPINKLSVISPYLVILGMIACLLALLKIILYRKD